MKRYFAEVKKVMSGEWTPEDFVINIFGTPYDWSDVMASRRIFIEDGGNPETFDNFNWNVKFPEGITLQTPF